MFKKIFLGAILLIFVAYLGAYFFKNKENLPSDKVFENNIINLNGYNFKIETADTEGARSQGLSGRESLCSECAMLFIFGKKDKRSFWMKDMKFDLDMLWIAGDEITQIDKNVSALKGINETRISKFPVDKVLEINAGESDRLGIMVGDKVKF